MTSGHSFMREMYDYLAGKCGTSDLPIIYVNGELMGGLAELNAAIDSGDLDKKLAVVYPSKADL